MITVETRGNERIYGLPVAVRDVALHLFPGADARIAVHRLFRALSAADIETVAQLALARGQDAAIAFARERQHIA